MPGRRLLLFDIDGTLILTEGAGEAALREAMAACFGVEEDLRTIKLAGATDTAIVGALLERHGLEASVEGRTALCDAYLHALREALPRHQGRLLPGITELLEELRRRQDECVTALLTGNLARGAELKLSHYGIWEYFEFGAFADDHADRNRLGHFARSRALEIHGEDFPPDRIYVIGDTPRDVDCGRAIGAKTVAIATGGYPRAALEACSPDFLFDDLSDTRRVLKALLG